jgi:hypothetical protein
MCDLRNKQTARDLRGDDTSRFASRGEMFTWVRWPQIKASVVSLSPGLLRWSATHTVHASPLNSSNFVIACYWRVRKCNKIRGQYVKKRSAEDCTMSVILENCETLYLRLRRKGTKDIQVFLLAMARRQLYLMRPHLGSQPPELSSSHWSQQPTRTRVPVWPPAFRSVFINRMLPCSRFLVPSVLRQRGGFQFALVSAAAHIATQPTEPTVSSLTSSLPPVRY